MVLDMDEIASGYARSTAREHRHGQKSLSRSREQEHPTDMNHDSPEP
jgi:hypothetical protein